MSFSPIESTSCQRLIQLALEEDLGPVANAIGDITSDLLLPGDVVGSAHLVARATGVVAGLPTLDLVCGRLSPRLQVARLVEDGTRVVHGLRLATVVGPMVALLAAERTMLNFVQHLSGVATQTRRYVDAVAGLPVKVLDTRKTLPGWRLLEKYAVRQGGGSNHRIGLYDQFLIKDNHLAAGRQVKLGLVDAIRRAQERRPSPQVLVEVEVETLAQLAEALTAGPDIVLLDNMSVAKMRQAVLLRNATSPDVLLEASGGVSLTTIRAIAETGVDRISVGALTHSAPALDMALDWG